MAFKTPQLRTVVFVVFGLALAALSAWHAMTMATRRMRPDTALALNPGEPVALIGMAAIEMATREQEKRPIPRDMSERARRSLSGLALNPMALRVLATPDGVQGGSKIDFNLIELSDRVSRRDLGTQVLRIFEGGKRSDVKLILDAYDKALTVHEESWQLLFPPLAQVITSPDGRREFSYFLDRGAPWLSPFFRSALNETDRPEPFFDVLIGNRRLAELAGNRDIQDVLVNSLVANGRWTMARQAFLYNDYGPASALTSASINDDTIGDGKNTLYWFFPQNARFAGVPINRRFLSVSAEPGFGGTVAQKIVYLRPGRYDLVTTAIEGERFEGVRLDWRAQCLSEEAALEDDLPVERSADNERLTHTFVVGAACTAVRLVLHAEGTRTGQAGSDVAIQDISLKPRR